MKMRFARCLRRVGRRRTGLCMTAVTVMLAVGGVSSAGATSASGPAQTRGPLGGGVLVDFRTSKDCPPGPPGNCDLFHFSLTNTTSSPIDGITLQWKDGAILQFASPEFPSACGTKGVVAGAFICQPIDVQPGASITGRGMASGPLTQGSPFQSYWTPDNFANATGVDTLFAVSPDPRAAADVKQAVKWEMRARTVVLWKNPFWRMPIADLRRSSALLRSAQGLVPGFTAARRYLGVAIRKNGLASTACSKHRRGSAVRNIRAALAAGNAGWKDLQAKAPL
jgi:hypothetical protein